MSATNVLVVDDDLNSTKPLFLKLFDEDTSLLVSYSESWEEFEREKLSKYSVVILDINLDKWGKRLTEALSIIEDRVPVILISRWWHLPDTHRHVSEGLAGSKRVRIIGTMSLDLLDVKTWKPTAAGMRMQLAFVLGRERRSSPLSLGENDSLVILHISDPQYCDPNTEQISDSVEVEIVKYIKETLRQPIHLVALTGDITYSGQPMEYERAGVRVESMLQRIFPNREDRRDRILLVPGNHDVDLRACAAGFLDIKFPKDSNASLTFQLADELSNDSHFKLGLRGFWDFAYKITEDARYLNPKFDTLVSDAFAHLGVRFILMNTVADLSAANPRKFSLTKPSLQSIEDLDTSDQGIFTMGLSHHGLPEQDGDKEAILNWRELMKAFQISKTRMLLHGHGHERRTDSIDIRCGLRREAKGMLENTEIIRVMAPTTHLNGKLRPPGESRGFNLVKLHRRYGRVDCVTVDHYELDNDFPHRSKAGVVEIRV